MPSPTTVDRTSRPTAGRPTAFVTTASNRINAATAIAFGVSSIGQPFGLVPANSSYSTASTELPSSSTGRQLEPFWRSEGASCQYPSSFEFA